MAINDFSETAGMEIDTEQFDQPTNWLTAKDAQGYVLVAMSADEGDTQYGHKMFLHVQLEGDSEAVDYTISFTERSAAFAQLKRTNEKQGSKAYPFRCIIEDVGRTYKLSGAPQPTKPARANTAGPERNPVNPRPALPQRRQQPVPAVYEDTESDGTENVPF